MNRSVAIIIPAYNEEHTIEAVVRAFHEQDASYGIYVVDNNSSDKTGNIARQTIKALGCPGGVISENRQGKAMAVRNAFTKVDAEIYVMVDADMTYPADAVKNLIEPVALGLVDMTVGDRLSGGEYEQENKRAFHAGGNFFVRWLISRLYGHPMHDILSGYRVFSRRFVKNYPVMCEGFELEADLTLHALDKKIAFKEVPIHYQDRPAGSESKLSTLSDGVRIITLIFNIFRHYKPFIFFGTCALACLLVGLFFGRVPIADYIYTKDVTHVPLAILASGLCVLSILFLSIALVLDSIAKNHKFNFELRWLAFEAVDNGCENGE